MKNVWIVMTALLCSSMSWVFGDGTTLKTHSQTETPAAPVSLELNLTERIKPIRTEFRRINEFTEWTRIKHIELDGTTEGGEAHFYYRDGKIQKIVARRYGETFQALEEYFLSDGRLMFVYEKTWRYNRPIYYDPSETDGTDDMESFDFDKSDIIETRSYFEKDLLFHQIHNPERPVSQDDLAREQQRLITSFEHLVRNIR